MRRADGMLWQKKVAKKSATRKAPAQSPNNAPFFSPALFRCVEGAEDGIDRKKDSGRGR